MPERTPVEHALRELLREIVREELAPIVEVLRRVEAAVVASAPAPADYLTPDQAAAIAGVTVDTVREWTRRGALPAHRAGRLVRVRRDELVAYLGRRSNGHDASEDSAARVQSIVSKLCGRE